MGQQIKFCSTRLANKGKRGVLTPDATGYYPMVVGGLNAYNSQGEYYTLEGAKELFESSSVFMRRILNGCLSGELDHPVWAPGMSEDDFMRRMFTIDKNNVVCHFKEIWLDENFGRNNPEYNNPDLVAIMALIKPSGPKGPSLQQSLENTEENVCFSIRALTRNYYHRGKTYRVLASIFTFDNVPEPGINIANKWSSPALETINDLVLTRRSVERIAAVDSPLIANEDSKLIAMEALHQFDKIVELPKIKPLYSQW